MDEPVAAKNKGDIWGDHMRAARAGDAAAYKTLLAELAMSLRATVRAALSRAGRGNADIEDIVQDVLLAVHLKRETWDARLPFSPWVNAIVRYKVIDALRRTGKRISVPIDDVTDTLPAAEPPEDHGGDLEKLVQQLDGRQQAIVRAIAIEQRSSAEVARTLGMTDGAVRVSLHRALKTLAKLYRTSNA